MSDILKGFFSGMEEFAKTMREHAIVSENSTAGQRELLERVNNLTERVEKLVGLLEEKLGAVIEITPAKGRRMMDIKEKIIETVNRHPEGIRPPQLAGILGTKVQNLYPHLKSSVGNKVLKRDRSGAYFPAKSVNGAE